MQTTVGNLNRVIMYLSDLSGDINLQQMQLFLEICNEHPTPITQQRLVKRLKITHSAISRNLRKFGSKVKGDKQVGLGLVTLSPDLYETRQLSARLTKKGEKVMNDIIKLATGKVKEL